MSSGISFRNLFCLYFEIFSSLETTGADLHACAVRQGRPLEVWVLTVFASRVELGSTNLA